MKRVQTQSFRENNSNTIAMRHVTVLKNESIEALNLKESSVVVDCTLGSGGHGMAIASHLGADGVYVGFDADPSAIKENEKRFSDVTPTVHLINDNFRNIQATLTELNITNVDAILADLGWRMEQFSGETPKARGFSFQTDEPLLMTYGNPEKYPFTAKDIVNEWDEEDIANVIYGYGEERAARKIARAIVEKRKDSLIETSLQLANLIAEVVKTPRRVKTHPATRTFQALRIAVNDEFEALETLLSDGFAALKPGGRMAIISFHSLEDRIVKHTFRSYVHDQQAVLVNKKPITASPEELENNPRSRSAKLRVIEKSNTSLQYD